MERKHKIVKPLVSVCKGASKNTPRQVMKNEDKCKEEKQREQPQQVVNKVHDCDRTVPKIVHRERKMREQRQREEQQHQPQQIEHYRRKNYRHQGRSANNVRNERVARLSSNENRYDDRCGNNDIISRNGNILDIHHWPTLEETTKKKNLPNENDNSEQDNPELNFTTAKVKDDKEKSQKDEKRNHCETHRNNGNNDTKKRKQTKWTPVNSDFIIHDRGTMRSKYNQRKRNGELKENEFCYEKINNRASGYYERGHNRQNFGARRQNYGQNDPKNGNLKHVVNEINDCEEVVSKSDHSKKKMPEQQQLREQQHQQQQREHNWRKDNRHRARDSHSEENGTIARPSHEGRCEGQPSQNNDIATRNASEDADFLNINDNRRPLHYDIFIHRQLKLAIRKQM